MRSSVAMALLLGLLVVSCRDDGEGSPRDPASTGQPQRSPQGVVQRPGPQGVASIPAAGDRPQSTSEPRDGPPDDESPRCAPVDPALKPLQLLRFTFTSAVKDKNPSDKLNVARPGQRLWAHLRVRNRSGRERCLHVVFRVNGKKRTEVDLEIGDSWNWRTWAYNTLRPSDRSGSLELEITTDQGKRLVHERLPIVPQAQ